MDSRSACGWVRGQLHIQRLQASVGNYYIKASVAQLLMDGSMH